MSFIAWVISVGVLMILIGIVRALIHDLRRKEGWMALAILIIIITLRQHGAW
jgi:hypothetical protein